MMMKAAGMMWAGAVEKSTQSDLGIGRDRTGLGWQWYSGWQQTHSALEAGQVYKKNKL